jgi:group I intron endonuclease
MVIYGIVNKINGKKYIGSAFVFTRRKNKHLSELRRGVHHSSILQNAWNKYGEDNFEFQILEEIDEKQILIEREQWWLDNSEREYNICPIAGNCERRKHTEESKRKIGEYNKTKRVFTEETRKKISDSKKGIKRDSSKWKNKKTGRSCYEYDKNGIFIKEWSSIIEVCHHYSVSESTIRSVITTNYLFNKSKRFSFDKKDFLDVETFKRKEKRVLQFDLNGDLIREWDSIKEIVIHLGLKTPTTISNCLNGLSKTAKGFIWKYKN